MLDDKVFFCFMFTGIHRIPNLAFIVPWLWEGKVSEETEVLFSFSALGFFFKDNQTEA
jgi:hypothetical protein